MKQHAGIPTKGKAHMAAEVQHHRVRFSLQTRLIERCWIIVRPFSRAAQPQPKINVAAHAQPVFESATAYQIRGRTAGLPVAMRSCGMKLIRHSDSEIHCTPIRVVSSQSSLPENSSSLITVWSQADDGSAPIPSAASAETGILSIVRELIPWYTYTEPVGPRDWSIGVVVRTNRVPTS